MAIKFRMADGMVVEFDTVEEAKSFGVDADEQGVDDSLSLSDIGEGDYVRFKTDYTDFADDFVSAGSLAVVDLIDSWDGHVSVHVGGKPWGFSVVWVDFKDVSTTLELVEEEADESGSSVSKHDFKVGDKVRLLDNRDPIRVYSEVGAIGTVVPGDTTLPTRMTVEIENTLFGDTQVVDHTQVELVKPIAQDANGEDLYEGDYVVGTVSNPYNITDSEMLCRVTDEVPDNPGFMEADMTVEITEDGFLSHKGDTFKVASKYFVKTTPEEFEESKQPEEPIFDAGDYARVKSLDGFMGGFSVGELVKVVDGEVNVKTGHIKVSKLSFEGYGYPNPSDVEKAELTDREKAFIKVGREIGEFKHGDIVNVDEEFSDGSDDAKEGLAEVRDGGIKASLVRQPESLTTIDAFGHHHLDKLTLICPVEQRLDIGGDADV